MLKFTAMGLVSKKGLKLEPTPHKSNQCEESAKVKAMKIVYSSLYLAFTPNNVLGDSHYANETSTLLSKYERAKINLFSHNDHIRADVEPWL